MIRATVPETSENPAATPYDVPTGNPTTKTTSAAAGVSDAECRAPAEEVVPLVVNVQIDFPTVPCENPPFPDCILLDPIVASKQIIPTYDDNTVPICGFTIDKVYRVASKATPSPPPSPPPPSPPPPLPPPQSPPACTARRSTPNSCGTNSASLRGRDPVWCGSVHSVARVALAVIMCRPRG